METLPSSHASLSPRCRTPDNADWWCRRRGRCFPCFFLFPHTLASSELPSSYTVFSFHARHTSPCNGTFPANTQTHIVYVRTFIAYCSEWRSVLNLITLLAVPWVAGWRIIRIWILPIKINSQEPCRRSAPDAVNSEWRRELQCWMWRIWGSAAQCLALRESSGIIFSCLWVFLVWQMLDGDDPGGAMVLFPKMKHLWNSLHRCDGLP